MTEKTHTRKIVFFLIVILFLPLAIYLLVSKQYVQFGAVIVTAIITENMLNRAFKDKKEEF